jgi:hypothetical protein
VSTFSSISAAALDVVVQRRALDAQALGQAARGQGFDALLVDERERLGGDGTMAIVTVTEQLEPPDLAQVDAQRLHELGYEQQLKRGLGIFDSVAVGFATISPVVGLYAVVLVGMVVAGGAWLWVLPVALAASACCSPSTPNWQRSSRWPTAPTSGTAA